MFNDRLSSLTILEERDSRSINAENPTGEKGNGGKASSILGKSRKGKAFLDLEPGTETTLADIKGPGIINHIWITVQDSSSKGEFVLRDLILRMYWDDDENPAVESPIGDFFCCGFLPKCQVISLPMVVVLMGFNFSFQCLLKKAQELCGKSTWGSYSCIFLYYKLLFSSNTSR